MNCYDDMRRQKTFSTSPARTATSSGSRHSRTGDGSDPGQPPVRCGTDVDLLLAQGASRRRRRGTDRAQTWPQTPISLGGSSSGYGGASDQRALSRPIETAVCPVDPRCRSTVDQETVWRLCFGLDGGPLSETMGLHTPETASSCLRTESRSGQTLAGKRLPGHSTPSSSRTGTDTLGR